MDNKGKIYTRKAVAQILDLSEKRVKQLTEEGIIGEFSPGHYKLLGVIQGYVKYLRTQISDDNSASDYNLEKARLTRLKREDAELELELKKNELHKSADVEFIMTNMLIAFKAKLEAMPYKVLPSIVNIPPDKDKADHITNVLKSAVDEALNELSGYNALLFDKTSYLAGLDDTVSEVGE